MPIHIDHLVTEVIDQPESSSEGEGSDERWAAQMKIEAYLKQTQRLERRLRAEGFDD